MKREFKGHSRRDFLGRSALGMAGILVLPFAGSCGRSKKAAGTPDMVRLGFIGLGRQAMFLINGFMQVPGVEVIAGCDVYEIKRTRFENRVNAFYSKAGKKVEVKTCEKYEDLLSEKDIDAVVIATPDHLHAMIAIAACRAGKDVYLEKPMTFTIYESQMLRKVVRETNRILSVGSQQRSDDNFRHAVNMVQAGALGKISLANAYVGGPPIPYNLPPEPVPAGLNWDLWLGPLPGNIHFNSQLNPPISLDPPKDEEIWGGWRWYKEMGGGFTTDWGAHMFDIAQWGLGMDNNGPVEISPIGDGTEFISFKYDNGIILTSEAWDEPKTKGVKFHGEKGWIEVARGFYNASDPKLFPEKKEEQTDMPYETRIPHQVNFIESVRSRKDPVASVDIGHSTTIICTLGNIACELKRTVKWNPGTETFVNDEEAAKLLHYAYREPWKLM